MNASAPEFTPSRSTVEEIRPDEIIMPTSSDPSQALWKPRYTGKIKSFNDAKGFGFVDCEKARASFGRDVFIHKNQVDSLGGLQMGTEVQFEIELNKNGQPQARNVVAIKSDELVVQETTPIEALLRECQNSFQVYDAVMQHNAELTHYEVVFALHQLATARKYENWQPNVPPILSRKLVERLMNDTPELLSMTDITRIVYAIAALNEVQTTQVRKYIFEGVAKEIMNHVPTFTPAQMTNIIGCMSQLRRTKREDEVVGNIVQAYNQILQAPGCNFPPEDANIWTMFLSSIVCKDFNYSQWGVPPPVTGVPALAAPIPEMSGSPLATGSQIHTNSSQATAFGHMNPMACNA
eukprot:GEMP01004874.1.p1 GENE.GEMP01004874.1~~GEMP01004874.1.p1  ORF type:complete len:351 (+),score=55.48 GEMP01004874.1:174-1226(+)